MTQKRICSLDFETTNSNPLEAEVIEIGVYDDAGESFEALYKSNLSIPAEVSMVNHITDDMLKDRPTFDVDVSKWYQLLSEYDYIISHNAEFEKSVLGLYVPKDEFKYICTFRIAKRLYQDNEEIVMNKLDYFRYFFGLETDYEKEHTPHRAGFDAAIGYSFFLHLMQEMMRRNMFPDDVHPFDYMYEYSIKLDDQMTGFNFGKHKGKRFSEVPLGYYQWAMKEMLNPNNDGFNADLAASLVKAENLNYNWISLDLFNWALNNMDCFDKNNSSYDEEFTETIIQHLDTRF